MFSNGERVIAESGKQKARNPQVSCSLAVRFLLLAFRWNDLKTGSKFLALDSRLWTVVWPKQICAGTHGGGV